ncbi:MAG: T9SS type A sorting domain-containing protein [Bacteroidota bacterium]
MNRTLTTMGMILFMGVIYFLNSGRSGGVANILNQDRTGSPFSVGTCNNCHSGGNFGATVGFSLLDATNTPVNAYVPGNTYTMVFTAANSSGSPSGYGMQAVALLGTNGQAGTMGSTITSNTQVTSLSGRQYLEHSGTNSAGDFRVSWTAPAAGSGNISIHYTANAVNGNFGTSGDQPTSQNTAIITEFCNPPVAAYTFNTVGATASFSDQTTGPTTGLLWDFGDGTTSSQSNPSHIYALPGTYTVCLTAIGCQTDSICQTVIITCPNLQTNVQANGSILCAGDSSVSVNLSTTNGIAPYSYQWSDGSTDAQRSNLPAGMYTITVQDSSGCAQTDSLTITGPDSLDLALSPRNVACFGDSTGSISTLLSGGNLPYQYLWSNGDTLFETQSLAAGTYSVVVTDNNGCTITDTVTISQNPALSANLTSLDITCAGDSNGNAAALASGGTPDYLYIWSTGDTANSISGLAAGTYVLTVQDLLGCTYLDSLSISEPDTLKLSAAATQQTNGGDGSIDVSVLGGTPPYTYDWSNGANTEDLENLPTGTYALTVIDSKGCTDSLEVVISPLSSLPDPISGHFSVFPNPAQTFLQVKALDQLSKPYHILLWDMQGKQVKVQESTGLQNRLDISALPQGMYLLEIQRDNQRFIQKILKR